MYWLSHFFVTKVLKVVVNKLTTVVSQVFFWREYLNRCWGSTCIILFFRYVYFCLLFTFFSFCRPFCKNTIQGFSLMKKSPRLLVFYLYNCWLLLYIVLSHNFGRRVPHCHIRRRGSLCDGSEIFDW